MKKSRIIVISALAVACLAGYVLNKPSAFNRSHSNTSGQDQALFKQANSKAKARDFLQKSANDPYLLAKQLSSMQKQLSPKQARELLELINAPAPANVSLMEWAGVVNELVNVLRRQSDYQKELSYELMELAENNEAGLILQDYAIQHLGCIYATPDLSQELSRSIYEVLQNTTRLKQRARCGTAVLALGDALAAEPQDSPRLQAFAQTLLELIQSTRTHPETRMAALSQAGNLKIKSLVGQAKAVAHNALYSLPERKTAINMIGSCGQSDDIQELNALGLATPQLAPAVQAAVNQLSN